jgi:transposase
MLRLTLTPTDRDAVQALRRDPSLRPAERDRVEMVLLSAAGWSPPAIAGHLGYHAVTVRKVLRAFAACGLPSLRHKRPGPAPDLTRRTQVEMALRALLAQERTWTAGQLATALHEQGILLSPRQTRKYLRRLAAWRRTVRSLRHKQDPERVAQAKTALAELKKRPKPVS